MPQSETKQINLDELRAGTERINGYSALMFTLAGRNPNWEGAAEAFSQLSIPDEQYVHMAINLNAPGVPQTAWLIIEHVTENKLETKPQSAWRKSLLNLLQKNDKADLEFEQAIVLIAQAAILHLEGLRDPAYSNAGLKLVIKGQIFEKLDQSKASSHDKNTLIRLYAEINS